MSAPFLILETGEPVDSMRRHGDFTHWIRVAAGLPHRAVQVCRVASGEALPRPEGFAGVLITGSGAMVTERLDWSERSADWLRDAAAHAVPMLGICYGHQLLAHAFGGAVDWNPAGREMGTHEVRLHPVAADDPLFRGLPQRFAAQLTHRQSVVAPPPGAAVLAESDRDACQAFALNGHVWGLQFHPEFSTGHMRGYIAARRAALHEEGVCPDRLQRAVRPAPVARRVLRRFVRHARHR